MRRVLMVGLCLLFAASPWAEPRNHSNRSKHKYGLYVGIIGDPFPTILGINTAYHLTDFLRANLGYGYYSATDYTGSTASVSTLGGGVKAFWPGKNFSPVVGLNVATVMFSGTTYSFSGGYKGFSGSASHLYVNFGIDWVAKGGFNLGLGFNKSFLSGVPLVPYLNLGWFF